MAQLFENQFKESKSNSEFLNEASATTTTNSDVAKYDTVLFNMLRKSLPSMIAFDICGVQAMSSPTGLIFAMRPTVVNTNVTGGAVEIWDETNLHRNLSGVTPTSVPHIPNTIAGIVTGKQIGRAHV